MIELAPRENRELSEVSFQQSFSKSLVVPCTKLSLRGLHRRYGGLPVLVHHQWGGRPPHLSGA